jgi:excisionase family DNA binding protein
VRNLPKIDAGEVMVWTVQMAADYLRVGVVRVRRLIRQGRLQASRSGRILLLNRLEVEGLRKLPGGRAKLSEAQKRDFEIWKAWGAFDGWMRTCPPSLMPGRCGVCGKMVGTVIPKGVEGCSVRVMVKHFPKVPIVMVLKTGRKVRGRCPGSGTAPKGWRTVEIPVGRF